MDALIYFAIWAGLIFFMLRFGCGAHVLGHGHQRDRAAAGPDGGRVDLRWVPPEQDVDPVCGETVDPATAKSCVHDGYVYYFCSAGCRERFEADPEGYLRGGGPRPTQLEHSHG